MNEVILNCINKLKGRNQKLVLPEGEDPRIQRAARELIALNIAIPVLLGDEQTIRTNAAVDLADISIINPSDTSNDSLSQALVGSKRKITTKNVSDYLAKPAYHGVAMLKTGQVDAMVAGAVLSTAKVIDAAFAVGPMAGVKTLSSFFLMSLKTPHEDVSRSVIFADCAINIDPNEEQLTEIAITSARSASKLLADTPRIAMLSFSTHGSARHTSVSKVANVVKLVRERAPEILIEGELQVDTALSPRVARTKLKDPGEVAGRANVLIFPDLNAGNIGYKLVQYCGGAQATGPVLQGFARPVCDLSRGATVEDIVSAAAVTMALSL